MIRSKEWAEADKNVDPNLNPNHAICSFLICDKILEFDDTIIQHIFEEYVNNSIKTQFYHNIIVSIKDGVFAYDTYNVVKKKMRMGILDSSFEKNKGHFLWAAPWYGDTSLEPIIYAQNDEISHIKKFLTIFSNYLQNQESYYSEPNDYLW